jgi:hypothetical protein
MIEHVASANILPGKEKEVEQAMVKFAAIVNQHYPQAHSHIVRNIDGKGSRIYIVDTWESLGTWETARDKVDSDPAAQALFQSVAELFDWNSAERHFYQIVSEL